jgi:hypothetical protein
MRNVRNANFVGGIRFCSWDRISEEVQAQFNSSSEYSFGHANHIPVPVQAHFCLEYRVG